MADNSVRINFIKTFVNTAGVMMDGLQIEKGRDMWYWRSAREVAEALSGVETGGGPSLTETAVFEYRSR